MSRPLRVDVKWSTVLPLYTGSTSNLQVSGFNFQVSGFTSQISGCRFFMFQVFQMFQVFLDFSQVFFQGFFLMFFNKCFSVF